MILKIILSLIFFIIIYQYNFSIDIPKVYYEETKINKQIYDSIESLKGYQTSIIAKNGLIHAFIVNFFRKGRDQKFKKEVLTNKHGQQFEIFSLEPVNAQKNTTVVIIIPGVGGHKDKEYMKLLVENIKEKNKIYVYNHIGMKIIKINRLWSVKSKNIKDSANWRDRGRRHICKTCEKKQSKLHISWCRNFIGGKFTSQLFGKQKKRN
jgi:hypothetical protein